jgi:hypothetical protein
MKSAYNLIDSRKLRDALDLSKEPDALRDRYGWHRSGQACLLARRLVEAGVPWVTAFFNHTIRGQDTHPDTADAYGWDTHNDIFDSLKNQLLPRFDRTFSVLLDDLEQRGLLKDTLVVSDRQAAYPQSNAVSPGDLVATMFHSLGVDPAGHFNDLAQRPFRIATGEPLVKLYG